MNIKRFSNGLLGSNAYVAWYDKECMIVDLGVEPSQVIAFVAKMELNVKYLVLTHGHYDHVHYIGQYVNEYPNAKIICHEKEISVLTDSEANVSSLVGATTCYNYNYKAVKDGDCLYLDGNCFKVLNMPGHTPGCICLYNEAEKIMFTGDVLFAYSYGRTDFKYGSTSDMIASLRKLHDMDKDITIYPGHDGSATIGQIF